VNPLESSSSKSSSTPRLVVLVNGVGWFEKGMCGSGSSYGKGVCSAPGDFGGGEPAHCV
jgi:hypothetical protein